MKQRCIALFSISLFACGGTAEEPTETASALATVAPQTGGPLSGLTAEELARFTDGQTSFATEEDEGDGLGPVLNGTSCTACHNTPAIGGTSTTVETRFGTRGANGSFDPLESLGGSLIQTTGIDTVSTACPAAQISGEAVPAEANVVTGRRTTPLFGLGLVDAVPDQTFVALAQRQRFFPDGVHGVVSRVLELTTGQMRVGKFGWKAQNPTLFQFSADAYLNEMGITSDLFPLDNCPQGDCSLRDCDLKEGVEDEDGDVPKFADFMTMLAPLPTRPHGVQARVGEQLFALVGCATCHVPTLTTGANSIAALNRVTFHPYSDFLLHDMGSLGDGIVQGSATARQMRTAPLWGVSAQPILLHDGRAQTLAAAIIAHDGEGRIAKERYQRLGRQAQQAILAFLADL